MPKIIFVNEMRILWIKIEFNSCLNEKFFFLSSLFRSCLITLAYLWSAICHEKNARVFFPQSCIRMCLSTSCYHFTPLKFLSLWLCICECILMWELYCCIVHYLMTVTHWTRAFFCGNKLWRSSKGESKEEEKNPMAS